MLSHIDIMSSFFPALPLFFFNKTINKCGVKAKKGNKNDRFLDAIVHIEIMGYIDWLLLWIVRSLLIPLSQFSVFFYAPPHSFVFLPFFHRDEMKSLQAALQKQLDDATERAEKQQATVRCVKLIFTAFEELKKALWLRYGYSHS